MATVRGAVWLGTVTLGAALLYLLLVVLPYFVNNLDRFPLADVAIGYHDPKDLWPTTIPYVGGWLHLFGYLSVVFTPMILLLVAVAGGAGVVGATARRSWSVAAANAAVAVACAAGTAWLLSPVGRALMTWQLD